jgi:hypothetical protein
MSVKNYDKAEVNFVAKRISIVTLNDHEIILQTKEDGISQNIVNVRRARSARSQHVSDAVNLDIILINATTSD